MFSTFSASEVEFIDFYCLADSIAKIGFSEISILVLDFGDWNFSFDEFYSYDNFFSCCWSQISLFFCKCSKII